MAMPTERVLATIREHRERLDFEVAADVGASLDAVHAAGAQLIATGAVISCTVTRFRDGEPLEARLYRVAGYVPQPAPGRRTRATS